MEDVFNKILLGRVSKYTASSSLSRNLAEMVETKIMLSDLWREYTSLKLTVASVKPIDGTFQVNAAACDHDSSTEWLTEDESEVRQRVFDNITWDDISMLAHREAGKMDAVNKQAIARIDAALTMPSILEKGTSHLLSDGTFLEHLQKPYFTHYAAMRRDCVEKARSINQQQLQLKAQATLGSKYEIRVSVQPSTWMVDFLSVFERARMQQSRYYPGPKEMSDVFFRAEYVHQLSTKEDKGGQKLLISYAMDLGYHLMRFAHVFTSVSFTPTPTHTYMSPTVYTDVEFLVHFAARYSKDIVYSNFLLRPSDYLCGNLRQQFARAVSQARACIITSFKGLFFKHTSTGIQLMRKVASETEDKREHVPVPADIMNVLLLDILPNNYILERGRVQDIISFGNIGGGSKDCRCESPLGRYLNFHEESFTQFRALTRRLGKSYPENVDVHAGNDAASLPCVQKVYAMLVTAAGAFTAFKTDGIVPVHNILARCMDYDEHRGEVVYASSGEMMPGLIFFVMLTSAVSVGKENEHFQRKKKPPGLLNITTRNNMSDAEFFPENKTHRKAFCDLFAYYSSLVQTMSASKLDAALPANYTSEDRKQGIRMVSEDRLRSLRHSSNMWEALAAYVTFVGNRNDLHEEPPQWNYFIAMNDEQGTNLSDYRDKRMLDVKAFYTLPLFFTVSALLVNTSRPMMSGVIESTSGNTIRETFNLARQLQDGLTQPQEHDVFQFIH